MKTTNLIAALTGAVLLFGMSNCSRSYPPLPEGTTEIFVSPSGNDSNPGTLEKPLGSIHQAVQKLEAGMTVTLLDGVFELDDIVVITGKVRLIIGSRFAGQRVQRRSSMGSTSTLRTHVSIRETTD